MLRSLIALTVLLAACGADSQDADAKPSKKNKGAEPATTEASAQASGAVLGTWSGGQITEGELQSDLEGELRSLEMKFLMDTYDKQSQYLEQKIMESVLNKEAEAQGKADINALLTYQIEEKTPPPTDEQIAAFYPTVERQLKGATLEEAKPMLAAELTRRNRSDRYMAYIGELKEKYAVDITLPYPDLPRVDVPVGDNDPTLGNIDAPITVVQFAEYQCPYCGTAAETVKGLRAKYPDEVRVVYKDFPLSFHDRAVPAAMAAHCAGEQDKYWEMSDILLQNQQALQDAQLSSYVEGLSIDTVQWKECYDSGKYEAIVMADFEEGQKIGVTATPTFFVNGIMVSGAQPVERFSVIIDRELNQ